jgi:hypothetical protein
LQNAKKKVSQKLIRPPKFTAGKKQSKKKVKADVEEEAK